jgi:hypothetical protein
MERSNPLAWMLPLGLVLASFCSQLTLAQFGHISLGPQYLYFEIVCHAKPLDGFYGDEQAVEDRKWSKANFNDSLFEICSAHSQSMVNYQGIVSLQSAIEHKCLPEALQNTSTIPIVI